MLRDISEDHVSELMAQLRVQGYNYSLGLMSATALATYTSPVEDFTEERNGRICIKENVNLRIVDGRHRCEAISKLAVSHAPNCPWAQEKIRITLLWKRDGSALSGREILHLGNAQNIGASVVRREVTLIECLKRLVAYSHTVEEDSGVRFLDTRNTNIVQDLMSSQFLGGGRGERSLSTYSRYVRVTKLIRKYPFILDYLVVLSTTKYRTDDNNLQLGIVHLDDKTLLTSDEFTCRVLLQAADISVKNKDRSGAFDAKRFYEECVKSLHWLNLVRTQLGGRYPTLREFFDVEIPKNSKSTFDAEKQTISTVFNNNIRLFDAASSLQTRADQPSLARKRRVRMWNRVRGHFFPQTATTAPGS